MISSIAWFCGDHCGVWALSRSWERTSPAFSSAEEVPALVGKPVKYYARMTRETRCCLFAATLAMESSGARSEVTEIGLIAAGSDGWMQASGEYFRDYVEHGRTLGRGNLFIYTLPTSGLGEVAIALGLSGPCMFAHDAKNPTAGLCRIGGQLLADGEAQVILGIYSSADAAVCLNLHRGSGVTEMNSLIAESGQLNPLELCMALRERVRKV